MSNIVKSSLPHSKQKAYPNRKPMFFCQCDQFGRDSSTPASTGAKPQGLVQREGNKAKKARVEARMDSLSEKLAKANKLPLPPIPPEKVFVPDFPEIPRLADYRRRHSLQTQYKGTH